VGFFLPIKKLSGCDLVFPGALQFNIWNLNSSGVTIPFPGGLSSSVNVKIFVSDANDNRPIFYPQHYAVNVRRNTNIGAALTIVKATDEDSGMLGTVKYFLTAGNQGNYFSVDQQTGTVPSLS